MTVYCATGQGTHLWASLIVMALLWHWHLRCSVFSPIRPFRANLSLTVFFKRQREESKFGEKRVCLPWKTENSGFLHYEKEGQLHPVSKSSESGAGFLKTNSKFLRVSSFFTMRNFFICLVRLHQEHFSQILPSADFFLKNDMCFCWCSSKWRGGLFIKTAQC